MMLRMELWTYTYKRFWLALVLLTSDLTLIKMSTRGGMSPMSITA